jgi:formylglycine-generating enzyme required for sulfatase activity
MHGNVKEWTADFFDAKYYADSPMRDPTGPSSGKAGARAVRGGAFFFYARECRAASRVGWAPATSLSLVGFRVACAIR